MTTATARDVGRVSRPRADALRNRERIVVAAREMFVQYGCEAPLDEIARRAGIGNATLYRHFADRRALIHDVVMYVLNRTVDQAERAEVEESDPFAALRRFAHLAADERIGVLCPILSSGFPEESPDLADACVRLVDAVEGLMERARNAGRLRQDVAAGDLMIALAQLTRPLPGTGVCIDMEPFIHRHVQVFVDGLEGPARSELSGSSATVEDLRSPHGIPVPAFRAP